MNFLDKVKKKSNQYRVLSIASSSQTKKKLNNNNKKMFKTIKIWLQIYNLAYKVITFKPNLCSLKDHKN